MTYLALKPHPLLWWLASVLVGAEGSEVQTERRSGKARRVTYCLGASAAIRLGVAGDDNRLTRLAIFPCGLSGGRAHVERKMAQIGRIVAPGRPCGTSCPGIPLAAQLRSVLRDCARHCMNQPWLTTSDCPVRALLSKPAK